MQNKFILTITLAILFSILSVQTFAANSDLSGTWTLDATKSEGLPPGMNQEMTIKQESDKLTVETKLITDKGEQVVPDTYTLDGKETDFAPKLPDGSTGKGKRTAKRTDNGFEVNDVSTFDMPDGTITVKITRQWALSPDGKILQIDINVEGPNGTQTVKRTFNRK